MNNLTVNAVIRQLKAMDCVSYKIGIFDRINNRMQNKDLLAPEEIVAMVPSLKYHNFNGEDIFITQATGIDRALLLVDDLVPEQIKTMKLRGLAPACVVETSPGNFQVWVSLGPEPMAKPERKAAARHLAEQFGGDMASTDASHYGRLAGFTNRKEKYHTDTGYPFVICREADGRDAAMSKPFRKWAREQCQALEAKAAASPAPVTILCGKRGKGDPAATFGRYFAEWANYAKASGKKLDISKGDFGVVCRMLKEGYDKNQIATGLLESSPDINIRKENHVEDYIARTIKAAENTIK